MAYPEGNLLWHRTKLTPRAFSNLTRSTFLWCAVAGRLEEGFPSGDMGSNHLCCSLLALCSKPPQSASNTGIYTGDDCNNPFVGHFSEHIFSAKILCSLLPLLQAPKLNEVHGTVFSWHHTARPSVESLGCSTERRSSMEAEEDARRYKMTTLAGFFGGNKSEKKPSCRARCWAGRCRTYQLSEKRLMAALITAAEPPRWRRGSKTHNRDVRQLPPSSLH